MADHHSPVADTGVALLNDYYRGKEALEKGAFSSISMKLRCLLEEDKLYQFRYITRLNKMRSIEVEIISYDILGIFRYSDRELVTVTVLPTAQRVGVSS